jgi:isoquinoline 1-oxidoreductase subunit alpha
MSLKLTINGTQKTITASPDTPLLWVLRDELNLKGTKFGCGAGLCGACTVHIDGVATRACQTPISSVQKAHITTIEAIDKNAIGSKVQKAWIENDVPQCGYCQSGQIMAATALLSKNPHPSDKDIDEAMSGNVCRCGTYPRIRASIHAVASKI